MGSSTFVLQAIDDTGSTIMSGAIVIVGSDSVHAPSSITAQLQKSGSLADEDSLALYTTDGFSIVFDQDTFTGPPGLQYAATSSDRSPLPSWVYFDPGSLTFSGLTPPLVEVPQVFGIDLIASTVAGFAEALVTFNLIVNDHQLVFEPFQYTVPFTSGVADLGSILNSHIQLDGQMIQSSALQSVTIDGPSWLDFDTRTMVLSGTNPANLQHQDITISAHDAYGDVAEALIHLQLSGSTRATHGTHSVVATRSRPQGQTQSMPSTDATATHRPTSIATSRTNRIGRLKSGGVAGIVIAVLLFLGLLVALLICCWKRRRQKRTSSLEKFRIKIVKAPSNAGLSEANNMEQAVRGESSPREMSQTRNARHHLSIIPVTGSLRDTRYDSADLALHQTETPNVGKVNASVAHAEGLERPQNSFRRSFSSIRRRRSRLSQISTPRRMPGLGHGRADYQGIPGELDIGMAGSRLSYLSSNIGAQQRKRRSKPSATDTEDDFATRYRTRLSDRGASKRSSVTLFSTYSSRDMVSRGSKRLRKSRYRESESSSVGAPPVPTIYTVEAAGPSRKGKERQVMGRRSILREDTDDSAYVTVDEEEEEEEEGGEEDENAAQARYPPGGNAPTGPSSDHFSYATSSRQRDLEELPRTPPSAIGRRADVDDKGRSSARSGRAFL